MGFWGPALFSNDTTCDVRGAYKDLLSDQLSNEEAYERVIEEFKETINSDEEPLFWFALADTQWGVGRLRPDVKEKALEWIEKDGGLDFWEDEPKGGDGWRKTLQKLKEKLESPMKKEKRFPKIDLNPWNLHDVYAYQFHDETVNWPEFLGKYMLLQKVGEGRYAEKQKLYMEIQALDHLFDELPELDDINKYRVLPLDDLGGKLAGTIWYKKRTEPYRLITKGTLHMFKPSDYPKKHLTFLGNKPKADDKDAGGRTTSLLTLEDFRIYYRVWQGKEYRTVEPGVYDYIPD